MVPRLSDRRCILTAATVVTGAGGYLGGRLVRHLSSTGGEVRGVARREAPWLGVPTEALDVARDLDALTAALEGAGTVVHLAGANQSAVADDPDRALAETAAAARNVAQACTAAGVGRIVHVSTVHVYGAALSPNARVDERSVPEPRSIYALSRLVAEHLLAMGEPELVVLRLTNGIGPPVVPEMSQWSLVVNDLSRQAVIAGALELHSDGQQYRDFVALDDVCRVVAVARDAESVAPGTYNFASGTALMIRDIAEMVRDAVEGATGERPPLQMMTPKGPPVDPYLVSPDALAAIGLRAEVPIRDAVTETVRFCLEHRDAIARETR